MRAFPTWAATDSVSLEYSGPTVCRLKALVSDRPLVIGRRQRNAIIFIRRVVPVVHELLCDNTDRGFISFDDGVVVGRGEMQTNNLNITCFNTGDVVRLKASYILIDDSVMTEVTTAQDGTPVDTIIFHKVSEK